MLLRSRSKSESESESETDTDSASRIAQLAALRSCIIGLWTRGPLPFAAIDAATATAFAATTTTSSTSLATNRCQHDAAQ